MATADDTASRAPEGIGALPPYELPVPDTTTKEFWDAVNRREFLIKRCDGCGRPHFYPRSFCPFCWSESVRWEQASGKATLYTYSVVRRNDLPKFAARVPYVAAIVELEEGPRVMTNVVGVDPDEVAIGMALEADYAPAGENGEALIPVFRPASA